MFRKSKKSSIIDQRLRDLQREMEELEKEVKKTQRAQTEQTVRKPEPIPRKPADDLFPDQKPHITVKKPPRETPRTAEATKKTSPAAPPSRREHFANYFMAGHFPDMRHSRQETRVVRNKAIILLIAIVLLLIIIWAVIR